MRYVSESPYARALVWRRNASNADLVQMTVAAARMAAAVVQWPDGLPRQRAARIAHDFARRSVRYVREDGDQLIRLPWRAIADGQGDCKTLSVLVASIGAAAGRSVALRFVQYPGESWFGHVYAVIDGTPVDPELDFGAEVVYLHRLDIAIR